MLDDFFIRALLAGIGVAIVAGPLGCFIVWRRLAYFGDTLSHSALLGVTLAFLLEVDMTFAVFVVSTLISVALLMLQKRWEVSSDSLLGLLSHSALALGLIALAFMTHIRIDLPALLFGDILSVSRTDLVFIGLGGSGVLLTLIAIWRPLFSATVSPELAAAEGGNPGRMNIVLMLLMAITIAISLKIVGALLITAMLIIPAVTARRFASGPEQMAVLAIVIGIVAVGAGLSGSLHWDTPSGPSIVVAALVLFLASMTPLAALISRQSGKREILGETKHDAT